MPYITSAAYAKTGRKPIDVHGQTYHLSPYVGSAPLRGSYTPGNEKNDDGLPQGFLVEQPPNSITPPHFHDHEQFPSHLLHLGLLMRHFERIMCSEQLFFWPPVLAGRIF